MNMELIAPHEGLRESYLGLIEELRNNQEPPIPFCVGFPTDDFPAFLQQINDCSLGIGIPDWFVPHTTYWLVRDGRDVVGVSSLRHRLTDALWKNGCHIGYGIRASERRKGYATLILEMTLEKAKEKGIGKVFITCHKSNVGSAKAILKNGGVLDAEYPLEGQPDVMQRYWIAQ
jgi:predicted acetyltransferase